MHQNACGGWLRPDSLDQHTAFDHHTDTIANLRIAVRAGLLNLK